MRLSDRSKVLITAYSRGIFPMAAEDGSISWYDPDPRGMLPLDRFHVPRRLAKTLRGEPFELRADTVFRQVMEGCAAPVPGRESTWISEELVEAYVELHAQGFAHSVEAWKDGVLVGGLYGVAVRGLFAGESMFSRVPYASQAALVHLVERLRAGGFLLLDTQFVTPHLARFGAVEISRAQYRTRLARALQVEGGFEAPGFTPKPPEEGVDSGQDPP